MAPTYAPCSKKQEAYLQSQADITVFGGGAGSGKTLMGILDFLQYVHEPMFKGVITRRNTPQLMGPGGPWDKCNEVFKAYDKNVRWLDKKKKFIFSSGAEIYLQHFEREANKENFQGWEISKILVDEGTQYTEDMVTYLMSRLRNPHCPVRTHMKITCNPDKDSYLRKWLSWYIGPDGLPIKERDGKLRWLARIDGKMAFADTKKDLYESFGKNIKPLSFTFLPATIYDNPVLMRLQPEYVSWLEGLNRVEKERLLYGNWDVTQESAGYWKAEWVNMVHLPPVEVHKRVRAWDLAGSLPSETSPNPDWTAGVKMSKTREGRTTVEDCVRFRARHGEVFDRILSTAMHDGEDVQIIIPCDPGVAGKAYAASIIRQLADYGFTARMRTSNKSKISRFAPFAAASEGGNVDMVHGEWNSDYILELEKFDGSRAVHDDMVDASSDAFSSLAESFILPSFAPPDLSQENPFR